ncbi:MAG: ribosome biogenesis GTPase Der [Nevskiaceae bacterium]|jgi:GTP-binding protein|nr:ribosome biogenesis GTPase Der [Nevskiaceae bacterium]
MLPIVALVGRPNVGKSTLFNTLTGTHDAIVADVPGVTRDRQYGFSRDAALPCVIVDTGGVVASPRSTVEQQMRAQTERAIAEADRLILVVDGRAGLTAEDMAVAKLLHRSGKPVVLAVNKSEGMDAGVIGADFHRLGLGEPLAIAAAHGAGCHALLTRALDGLDPITDEEEAPQDDSIRIAVIGRPNVGKSTLVNRLIGEERVIATDLPGTTRDSIFVPFERDGRRFTLIDTAGVRRRARVEDPVERASVARTLQAIDAAHIVVLVLDAHAGIAEQDASVLGLALRRGRALLLAVNKWDGIPMDQREAVRNDLSLRLDFVPFAPVHTISARHGTGVGELAAAAVRAYDAAMRDMSTPQLTRVMEKALEAHQPPLVKGRRIKLRYAHQGGRNPPRIVIHGTQSSQTPDAYRRYLSNVFREAFDLYASPVALEFRSDANPYGSKDERAAAARKLAAKKKAGVQKAARRVPRKKVAAGKPSGRRPR